MQNNNLYVRNRRIPPEVPIFTIILIVINIGVFIFTEVRGSSLDTEFMLSMGASYEPYIVEGGQYWRLITHFFLHFGWDHLFNNMISLLVLGYATETVLGHVRFISLYILSGIVAGVVSVMYNMNAADGASVSCGASGAIFGLSGALLILLIRGNRGRLSTEVPRFLIYMVLSLYSGYLDTSIDHAAHIGGFICGAFICLLMTFFDKRISLTFGR
ncbi:MAG: rhomboid family intramembrane serine protease [Eubacterium sp.]|nr:rhomboid family intramembrane serine protease [Eubacterium sp.]